jgi:hypothetical protein
MSVMRIAVGTEKNRRREVAFGTYADVAIGRQAEVFIPKGCRITDGRRHSPAGRRRYADLTWRRGGQPG